jgi:hypothetical protein
LPGKTRDRAEDNHDAGGDQVGQQREDDPDRPVPVVVGYHHGGEEE